MSRTYKKPYTKSKRFDSSCRNHGGCGYCEGTRTYFDKRKRLYWKLDLEDYFMERWQSLAECSCLENISP